MSVSFKCLIVSVSVVELGARGVTVIVVEVLSPTKVQTMSEAVYISLSTNAI